MRYLILVAVTLLPILNAQATDVPGSLTEHTWTVNTTKRTADIYTPPSTATKPTNGFPVVFVFHGHGGTSRNTERTFAIHQSWPDAIVLYPQGLPTIGQLTDPKGNLAGWDDKTPSASNKDSLFFDAMMDTLQKDYPLDPKRIFITGLSNGGGFTFYLWATHADALTAFAPTSAVDGRNIGKFAPKPMMLISGKHDPLVSFQWQSRMADAIEKLDKVATPAKPWNPGGPDALWYDSPTNPVVTLFHDGGHGLPPDAGKHIVAFFKQVSP